MGWIGAERLWRDLPVPTPAFAESVFSFDSNARNEESFIKDCSKVFGPNESSPLHVSAPCVSLYVTVGPSQAVTTLWRRSHPCTRYILSHLWPSL